MKLTLLAFLTASALPALADQWVVEWWLTNTIPGKQGILTSTWYSSTNGKLGEMIKYKDNGCVANPGPRGMKEFCIYDARHGNFGTFTYEGQARRCLGLKSKTGSDDADGREVWDEVACK